MSDRLMVVISDKIKSGQFREILLFRNFIMNSRLRLNQYSTEMILLPAMLNVANISRARSVIGGIVGPNMPISCFGKLHEFYQFYYVLSPCCLFIHLASIYNYQAVHQNNNNCRYISTYFHIHRCLLLYYVQGHGHVYWYCGYW